jgi:hypothetical protein
MSAVRLSLAALLCLRILLAQESPAPLQRVELKAAELYEFNSPADSNGPAFWYDGEFNLLTSTGEPIRSFGRDQFTLESTQPVLLNSRYHLPLWIESVWQDQDGTLYGWYHSERLDVCNNSTLTEPRIGAVVSYDGGRSFRDMGIVLESGDGVDCESQNGFFAGGHGDFSVILDRDRNYFYFLFDNYAGELSGQGVAVARMAFAERMHPMGAVSKYYNGEWSEPGLGGRMTPILPAMVGWQQANTDAFWGPSVHWNTYLKAYVVLLNRTCCEPGWPQEGIYVTLNPDLSNPAGWSQPLKILTRDDVDSGYYPQVLGIGPDETDSVAGQVARLYVAGRSVWEIVFAKEDPPPADPPPDPAQQPNLRVVP